MHVKTQDILDVEWGIIAHQVNMVGVMGAGLAKKIREKWPIAYSLYKMRGLRLGECQVVEVSPGLHIANLCAQSGFGGGQCWTDYDALRWGMATLSVFAKERCLQVYLPHGIGCGLAGGDWEIVSGIIEDKLSDAIVCRLSA